MSNIDWSKAPEGATEIRENIIGGYLRWFNEEGKAWDGFKWFGSLEEYKLVATREPEQQRKTVEDAVEYYNGEYPAPFLGFIAFNPTTECFGAYGTYNVLNEKWYHVCTREEFEACVADEAKSEPEWTHRLDGGRCKIILDKPDIDEDIFVLCEDGDYQIVGFEVLKPIKPKITKAQAWDLFTKDFWSATNILDKHEVVE